MSQFIFSLAAALIAFWAAHSYIYPALFPTQPEEVSSLSLEETIVDIKRELNQIGQAPGETAGLVLKDVAIELTAQRDNKNGISGELVVPVFKEASMKGEWSGRLSTGSKISVVFNAPPGQELLASVEPGSLDLSELVLKARKALLSAKADTSGLDLTPKSVDIEVSFVFVKGKSVSTGVKAYIVNIGASSEQVDTGGNKVTLHYRNPMFAEKKDNQEEKPIPPR